MPCTTATHTLESDNEEGLERKQPDGSVISVILGQYVLQWVPPGWVPEPIDTIACDTITCDPGERHALELSIAAQRMAVESARRAYERSEGFPWKARGHLLDELKGAHRLTLSAILPLAVFAARAAMRVI